MSLDPLYEMLWIVFSSPVAWAAAAAVCLGVAIALLSAIARIGKTQTRGGDS